MKLPDQINEVTLYAGFEPGYPYPPLGFYPIWEHELGNGDMFGLYWPIGKEDDDPILAEMWHDSRSIAPHFSSLSHFLKSSRQIGEDGLPETPSIDDDPQSPRACHQGARDALKKNSPDTAIFLLEIAISILPEYTEAQAILATQYRRVGRLDDAVEAAIHALISPPSFGGDVSQALRFLAAQQVPPESLRDDPIWNKRNRLKWKFSGEKLNDDYLILREAIDVYLSQERIIEAMTLAQTYGELMTCETVSFQERYSFSPTEHVRWQIKLSEEIHGKSRRLHI